MNEHSQLNKAPSEKVDENTIAYSEENKLTIEYYEERASYWQQAEEFRKRQERHTEWVIKSLEIAVAGLEKSSKILELGSGLGKDAQYLSNLGYKVEVSDASQGFVDILNDLGFKARRLDVLTTNFLENYDLIIANCVFQHFHSSQLEMIIAKVFQSLRPSGRFSFIIAGGAGEGFLQSSIAESFYWCRWSPDDLRYLLKQAGFPQADISVHLDINKSSWLSVFVEKPGSIDNN